MLGRKSFLRIRKILRKATENYRSQYLDEKRKLSYNLCMVLVCLGVAKYCIRYDLHFKILTYKR